ncbi:hypothetical protein OROHE_017569 [Orobanche hederae]
MIREKLLSRISQVATSIQRPTFPARQTSSNISISLSQTRPTPFPTHSIPTLRQSKHALNPPHRVTSIPHRNRGQIINQLPNISLKFRIDPIRRPHRAIAIHRIQNGVDALVEKSVAIVTEETPIEENPAGDGGEAAGEARAAGGEALEAIVVRQIAVALSQAVDRDISGIYSVAAPVVGCHALRENFHSAHEQWDVVGIQRRPRAAADKTRFGNSRVGL